MPELPEVETVKRTLTELIMKETITKVSVGWPKMIKEPDDVTLFSTMMAGQTFKSIERRGKFLIFRLDDYSLVSHLRMEGRYSVSNSDEPTTKHTHVRFFLANGKELRYADVRKFGTMHLFPLGTECQRLPLVKLGPEPLSPDFSPVQLKEPLQRTTRAIKSALLDQTVVAGLGNIYVDEALFKARVHPEKTANMLTDEEIEQLFISIKQTLLDAVKAGGSSIKSYVNGQGEMGMFQQQLNVYGRTGEPCHTCDNMIVRSVVGGRGTHTCPTCQPS
ncbi:DNA-formamidopyrimidine glycosylase [Salipaludibacillus sp. LMS25]|jgi:formamidopyrimidine-DNA glycosylase|uniref:DNA-formamidopyrimidine glycosylase n=1 Tax=Salipaludibacillus sp. LMS25 TaxID=2924031 RepID=UPI0020D07A80|nr:DNA-formamidopyrimidine glycosylase [Salipaludibacillus sp. LMS25]UTR15575.1 DNA-formamidopyrimidine glycosylase [Salipaludibacillus sp. LMS25]